MSHIRRNPNACITCRRRKVKCDRIDLPCQRCRTAFIPCEGYDKSIKFVNHTLNYRRPASDWTNTSVQRPEIRSTIGSCSSSLSCFPISSLKLDGFANEMSMSFLTHKLFMGQLPGHASQEYSWLVTALNNDHLSILPEAALAVAKAYFARIHDQRMLLNDAALQYGIAMRRLNSSLLQADTGNIASMLVAILLFTFYETLCPTSKHAIIQHASGMELLLKRFGPEVFASQPLHGYFLQNRTVVIGHALLSSKRTILADTTWQHVPWTGGPPKSAYHGLWDILAALCSVMEESEFKTDSRRVMYCAWDWYQDSISIRARVESLLHDLALWRWSWQRRHPKSVWRFQIDSVQTFLPRQVETFAHTSHVFGYDDVMRARELMLFNTGMIHLLRLAIDWKVDTTTILHKALPADHTEFIGVTNLPRPNLSLSALIHDVIQSIDYIVLQWRLKAGLSFLTFAFDAIRRCRTRCEDLEWFTPTMQRIAEHTGFHFFRQLCDELI